MSVCVCVLPSGESLDLCEDQRIEIIKTNEIFSNIAAVSSDYTFPICVRDTPNNFELLKSLEKCERSQISTIIKSSGLEILKGLRLIQVNKRARNCDRNIQVIGDELAWRNLLGDKEFCDLITYGKHNYTTIHTSITQTWNGDTGELYTYPTINYGGSLELKPAYFIKQHLIAAFDAIGYTFKYKGDIALSNEIRDLIIPFFNGVVLDERQNIVGADLHENVGLAGTTLDEAFFFDFYNNEGTNNLIYGSQDPSDLIPVIYGNILGNGSNVQLLPDDENGIAQWNINGTTFSDYSHTMQRDGNLCAITKGKYEVTILINLTIAMQVVVQGFGTNTTTSVTEIRNLTERITVTKELDCECLTAGYVFDFSGATDANSNNFLSFFFDGETYEIFNEDSYLSTNPDVLYIYNNGSLDDPFNNDDISPKLSIYVGYKSSGEQGVCLGNPVSLDLNCLNIKVIDTIDFLQKKYGFLFLTDNDNKEVCMIHSKDFYGDDWNVYKKAEDWRDKIDCKSCTEERISNRYTRFLCIGYNNDSDDFIKEYEEERGNEITLGRGCYELQDANLKDEDTDFNGGGIFSATPMGEFPADGGVLIPVAQIGDAPNDKTTPRILIHDRPYVYTYTLGDGVTRLGRYSYAYFYDIDRFSLDFSDRHGTGLINRFWCREFEIIDCGFLLSCEVYLCDADIYSLIMSSAKIVTQVCGQMAYAYIENLNYILGGQELTTVNFRVLP